MISQIAASMTMVSTTIAAVVEAVVEAVAEAAVGDVVGARTTITTNQIRMRIHPRIATATSVVRTII